MTRVCKAAKELIDTLAETVKTTPSANPTDAGAASIYTGLLALTAQLAEATHQLERIADSLEARQE